MLLEKRIRDIKKGHYKWDYDFDFERGEDGIPLYFVDKGVRKGHILLRGDDSYICLWDVMIYPEFRRLGLGAQMLNETLSYITQKYPKVSTVGLGFILIMRLQYHYTKK